MAAPVTGGVVLLLWLWTVLASSVHWSVVTAFWAIVGGILWAWVHRDFSKHEGEFETIAQSLGSVLRSDLADVYDIRARSFAELQEIEDEGACYAFELDDDRLVFVAGQEFYAGARFPSLDFSLVYLLDEAGRPVDMVIDKRGTKARPAKTLPAAVKAALEVPEHLELRRGELADLEAILSRSSARIR